MSLLNEAVLRELIRDEVRTAIRQELGHKPAAPGDFVSVEEASRIASVSPQAIRTWIHAGKLTGYKAGRVLRVKRSELDAFLTLGPASKSPESPEELADQRFRQRLARRRVNTVPDVE